MSSNYSTVPTEPSPVIEPASTTSLSALAFEAFNPSSLIVPSSSTAVTTSVYIPETSVSLASSLIPSTYFESLFGGTQSSFVGDADPVGAPETGSIAMIGSGLIFLGLFANSTRRRRRLRS